MQTKTKKCKQNAEKCKIKAKINVKLNKNLINTWDNLVLFKLFFTNILGQNQ